MLDFVGSDALAGGNRKLFRPFRDRSLSEEAFLVLADYPRAILNVARMGKFASDRSIPAVWRVNG